MIHGRNLIVALDGVAVAAAKTCSLDIEQSFLEACSPVSGRTHTKIPTTYDWGVSVDGLVANNSSPTVSLQDLLIAGTKCLLTFTDGSGNRRAGFVYVKSCKESGPVSGLATYSASFESSGELLKYTKYTPLSFDEGAEWYLTITDNHIDLSKDRHSSIIGVGITVTKASTLLVNCDSPWGLTEMSWNSAKETLAQDLGWQDIEQNEVACGEDDVAYITLNPGNYTFLCQEDSAISGLVLMY